MNLSRSLLIVLFLMVAVGGLVFLYVWSGRSNVTLTFSPTQVLGATWVAYKSTMIEAESGRTLDASRGNITTSEGQSYTMLRAVWMGDKATFDTAWKWTKEHLQHSNDHLFSWLYGKRTDGTFGVLTDERGNNSASDGDQDIALALIFAYARWQDHAYLDEARLIISDLWTKEVIIIEGKPYLAADDQEKTSSLSYAYINPSYFSPAAYRIFALADPKHPWTQLVDSSYELLGRSIDAPLDARTSAGLPPDWIVMDKTTGSVSAPPEASNTTNFGYDALRVPWRLALDYQWFGEPRAGEVLSRLKFLTYTWNSAKAIGAVYKHDGSAVERKQSSALYGGAIGYFMLADESNAAEVYQKKLLALYDPDTNQWKEQLSYYDANWVWFGIGLYNHLLPNLAEALPTAAWR